MHPSLLQALGDRVVGVEDGDLEIMLRPVARISTLPFRDHHDLLIRADNQAWPEVPVPPAQADHLIVGGPVGKELLAE